MDLRTILVVLCAGLVSLDCVHSQDCTAPPKGPGQSFPDLYQITGGSFMLSVEINLPEDNVTIYTTEYADVKNRRSRIQMDHFQESHTILSYGDTDEIFQIKGDSCTSVKKTDFLKMLLEMENFAIQDFDLLGLSNLLRGAYLAWKGDGNIGASPEYKTIRGMKCSEWTWCTKNQQTIKIYFTDPRIEHPYGLDDIPVPLLVTIHEANSKVYHNEVFRMIPKIPEKQMDELMQIPPTKGCNRTEKVRKAPSFATKDLYLEAEIIYTPYLNNDKRYTYVSNIKYVNHRASDVSALHWTPWTKQTDNGMILPGDHTFEVFDNKNGFTYRMDRTNETCKRSTNMGMKFDLPDGEDLNDLGEDLLFFGDDASSYNFLGKTTERGIPAAVFEKVEENIEALSERTLTRYYMDDSALLDDEFQERNAPLKMILWNINVDNKEFFGEVVINVYGFQTHFHNVHEMFDVSACFEEEDQSKWFQIIFPLGDNSYSDIQPHLSHIRNDLPPRLQAFDKDKSPLRIPRIEVDIDPQNVYVTGLILERPDFKLDFSETADKSLKHNVATTKTRISNFNDCAKSCLENAFCQYFSHCGAVCVIQTSDKLVPGNDFETKTGCKLYNNTLYHDLVSDSVWTMDQLSSSIQAAVEAQSLMMTYFKPDGTPLDLIAMSFKDNIAFGRKGMEEKRERNPDFWFSEYKSGYALVSKSSAGSRTIKGVSFEKCKSTCTSVPWCESVSYCLASGECVLTPKFREQIPPEEITENTQCMILSRNYVDRYKRYDGTVVVREGAKYTEAGTAEECAKTCFKENAFDCLSFDYCFYDQKNCVLHMKHYESGMLSENQTLGASEECKHYSKKIIYDFDQFMNQDMEKNVAGLRLDDVTPEECARMCRDERYLQPCAGFSHCSGQLGADSTCVLRKESSQPMVAKDGCNSYTWKK